MTDKSKVTNLPPQPQTMQAVVVPIEQWAQIVDYIRTTPAEPMKFQPVMNAIQQMQPQEVTIKPND